MKYVQYKVQRQGHSKARFEVLWSECLQLSRFLSQAKEGASLAAAWSKQRESQRGKEREIAEDKSEMIKRSKESKLQLATYAIAQNYHVV